MKVRDSIRSTAQYFLANNLTVAKALARTTRLFTRRVRQTNVAMFHTGRCGSTVVGTLLNQHPDIRWIGEPFAHLKGKYGRDSWVWERPRMMIDLRESLHLCQTFGFEIKRKHFGDVNITKTGLVNYLEKSGYSKYVILERENYLKKKVSAIVGNRIGKWNTESEVDPPSVRVPIRCNTGETILDYFREMDRYYSSMRSILKDKDVIYITYENDIKENPKKAFKRLVDFFEMNTVDVEVKTKKINKKPLKYRISNFQQVSNFLYETKYEWMLGDR